MKRSRPFFILGMFLLAGCVTMGVVVPLPKPQPSPEAEFAPPLELSWVRCLRPREMGL